MSSATTSSTTTTKYLYHGPSSDSVSTGYMPPELEFGAEYETEPIAAFSGYCRIVPPLTDDATKMYQLGWFRPVNPSPVVAHLTTPQAVGFTPNGPTATPTTANEPTALGHPGGQVTT